MIGTPCAGRFFGRVATILHIPEAKPPCRFHLPLELTPRELSMDSDFDHGRPLVPFVNPRVRVALIPSRRLAGDLLFDNSRPSAGRRLLDDHPKDKPSE